MICDENRTSLLNLQLKRKMTIYSSCNLVGGYDKQIRIHTISCIHLSFSFVRFYIDLFYQKYDTKVKKENIRLNEV